METSTWINSFEADLSIFLNPPDQWPNVKGYLPLRQKLREIRVLTIAFAEGSRQINGTIKHISLGAPDHQAYVALSYCWGPPAQLKPIFIHGQKVMIRSTLYSFLYALCAQQQTADIWLDSVCINQQDVQERSWQVTMMGDIYSLATHVNVWLGDADVYSEYVFSYIQQQGSINLKASPYEDEIKKHLAASVS